MAKEREEFFGSGKSVYLALEDLKDFDEILTFYESHLSAEWKRCPSDEIDWPSASGMFPARHASWFNLENHRFFWVATVDVVTEDVPEEFIESELIALGHDADETTWDLYYRGVCAPRNPQLFSPVAIISGRFSCGSASRNSPFEAQAWRDADAMTRGLMTDDLICRGLLLGLDEQEIVDLLGEPDAWSDGTFAYRVHMPLNPDLPRLPEGTLECPENWAELRFDFAIEIPEESYSPFWIDYVCQAAGT